MTIRMLRDDEPIPTGEPKRYVSSHGYVRLRWKVDVEQYVEAYEHRIVMGRPIEQHVHHVDGDKTNNNPSNLVLLTADEHGALHVAQDRAAGKYQGREKAREADVRKDALDAWWDEVAEFYAAGLSTTELGRMFGKDASNIYRGLKQRGVAMRAAGWTGVRQTQGMRV